MPDSAQISDNRKRETQHLLDLSFRLSWRIHELLAVGGATFATITTIILYIIIAYAAIILIIALHSATRQARNLSSFLFALVARKALVCGAESVVLEKT